MNVITVLSSLAQVLHFPRDITCWSASLPLISLFPRILLSSKKTSMPVTC